MNESYGTAVIFISHDLRIIRKLCDRVVVMKDGRIVERGTVAEVFENPLAPYTKKLIAAAPENLSLVKPRDFTDEKRLLRVQDLDVWYPGKSGRLFARQKKNVVVKQASLEIREGEILGLVGESGCGKSTLAKAVAKLLKTRKGKIKLINTDLRMVFQDPFESLNPSKKIGWLLKEPLRLNKRMSRKEMEKQVDDILAKVELPVRYKDRFPSELSGGERQRVAIAMALILKSRLIILDEPVSALDVTVQEQILKLLVKLRDEYDLSYLFISHDMQVVRRICDNVAVMYKGEIIEYGTPEKIFEHPEQEYTKKLINAAEINI
jgi:peptide/nickel transport system ATP-binding protein